MNKHLVIFLSVMLALPVFAQQAEPNRLWLKTMKEVISTSDAMTYTKSLTGANPAITKDEVWRDIIFNPQFSEMAQLAGTFELIDLDEKTTKTGDTTLMVSVSNLSVAWSVPSGTDGTDPRFLVPTYEVGTMNIIKSYQPSTGGQGGNGVLAAASSPTKTARADSAAVTWIIPDESFSINLNGEDHIYFKKDDEWKSDDPNAPKVLSLGKTGLFGLGREQFVLVTKDSEGVWGPSASNVANAYRKGMGNWAGFHNNYGTGRNGAPLGSYGLMPIASTYYPNLYSQPWGGGWNSGYGYGGFSAGFGISFGFGSGGCFAPNPYYCSNRWATGGPAIWNGYELVAISTGYNTGGYGYGYNGYYNNGYGGCKSAEAVGEEMVMTEVSAVEEVVTKGLSQAQPALSKAIIPPTNKALTSQVGAANPSMREERQAEPMAMLDVPATHGTSISNGRSTTTSNGASKPLVGETMRVPATRAESAYKEPAISREQQAQRGSGNYEQFRGTTTDRSRGTAGQQQRTPQYVQRQPQQAQAQVAARAQAQARTQAPAQRGNTGARPMGNPSVQQRPTVNRYTARAPQQVNHTVNRAPAPQRAAPPQRVVGKR